MKTKIKTTMNAIANNNTITTRNMSSALGYEASMEIIKTSIFRSAVNQPHRKKREKMMTLDEFFALSAQNEAERKEAVRLEAPSAKTLRNRRKRKAMKEARTNGFKEIKKNVVQWANISYPQNWSKDLYKASEKTNGFVNTTLILKNLPYDNVTERDIKRFFSKSCGPVKLVNVLKDGGRCKGIAFVRFENVLGSDRGLTMNGFWYNDRRVYVEYAEDNRNKK